MTPQELTPKQRNIYEGCANEIKDLCQLWTKEREFVDKIPDHQHWNNGNCANLRNLVAAIIYKHFPIVSFRQ